MEIEVGDVECPCYNLHHCIPSIVSIVLGDHSIDSPRTQCVIPVRKLSQQQLASVIGRITKLWYRKTWMIDLCEVVDCNSLKHPKELSFVGNNSLVELGRDIQAVTEIFFVGRKHRLVGSCHDLIKKACLFSATDNSKRFNSWNQFFQRLDNRLKTWFGANLYKQNIKFPEMAQLGN